MPLETSEDVLAMFAPDVGGEVGFLTFAAGFVKDVPVIMARGRRPGSGFGGGAVAPRRTAQIPASVLSGVRDEFERDGALMELNGETYRIKTIELDEIEGIYLVELAKQVTP